MQTTNTPDTINANVAIADRIWTSDDAYIDGVKQFVPEHQDEIIDSPEMSDIDDRAFLKCLRLGLGYSPHLSILNPPSLENLHIMFKDYSRGKPDKWYLVLYMGTLKQPVNMFPRIHFMYIDWDQPELNHRPSAYFNF